MTVNEPLRKAINYVKETYYLSGVKLTPNIPKSVKTVYPDGWKQTSLCPAFVQECSQTPAHQPPCAPCPGSLQNEAPTPAHSESFARVANHRLQVLEQSSS